MTSVKASRENLISDFTYATFICKSVYNLKTVTLAGRLHFG